MRFRIALYSLFALVVSCSIAIGQTITGSVTGTVTDASGAAVAAAKIAATNVDTGVETSTTTNSNGSYVIRFLQIGHYKISIEAQGFSPASVGPFSLEVSQEAKIDAKLKVGSVNQDVVVTSAAPILNTENPSTGTTITSGQVSELPMQARNFSSITTLVAGAVIPNPAAQNNVGRSGYNGGFFVNGNREQTNNYTLDGVDFNDPIDNYIGYNPNPDAIGEMRIISGNATAEYGNANGGQVVLVTKSGTNQFHGNAFWFLENTNLNANSWSNKHTADIAAIGPVPTLNRSIFGGTLGGPVIHNRLFFFVDYQGNRQHATKSEFTNVATAAMRTGYSPALGRSFTVTNPVALYLFAHPEIYPLPNVTTANGSLVNNYVGTTSNATRLNQGDIKVDSKLTAKDNLSGRFTLSRENDGDNTVSLPTKMGGVNSNPYTSFAVNWTHSFANAVNEARIGFSRGRFINGTADLGGKFGLTGISTLGIRGGAQIVPGIPAFQFASNNVTAISTIGGSGAGNGVPSQNDSLTNTFTYGDNLSWTHGHHTIKVGGQALRYQSNRNYSGNDGALGHFDYDGTYSKANFGTADAFTDFILNQAQAYGQGSFTAAWGQRQWRDAFFFQDDWKITPNLTINLGMRWEWDQPLYESNNKQSNLNITTGVITTAGQNGASRALYHDFWNGWMPRVGFAYSPENFNGKFVVRGGYGMTNFLEGTGANLRLTLNPPFFIDASNKQNGNSPYFQTGNGFATPLSTLPDGSPVWSGNVRAWDPKLKPALIQQFNLTTETQLSPTTSLVIAYLGQNGNHLVDPREGNQAPCLGCALPMAALATSASNSLTASQKAQITNISQISYTESESMMNYNSLQVTGRHRISHGLEVLANYTFSKGLTNNLGYYGASNTAGAGAYWQNAYNGGADYGPAFFDSTHIFTFAGNYELPFGRGHQFGANMNRALDEVVGGWKLGVLANLHSGFPFTTQSAGNYKVNQRSNRANHYRKLIVQNRSVDHWFGTDPTATPCGINQDNGTCAYGAESTTGFGNASVGSERSPGYKDVDASLSKAFTIYHETNLQFHADFFNVLNTTSLSNPNQGVDNGNFGQITSTTSTERQIQLALKLTF